MNDGYILRVRLILHDNLLVARRGRTIKSACSFHILVNNDAALESDWPNPPRCACSFPILVNNDTGLKFD